MFRTQNARFAAVVAGFLIVFYNGIAVLLRFASDLTTWGGAYWGATQALFAGVVTVVVLVSIIFLGMVASNWISRGQKNAKD